MAPNFANSSTATLTRQDLRAALIVIQSMAEGTDEIIWVPCWSSGTLAQDVGPDIRVQPDIRARRAKESAAIARHLEPLPRQPRVARIPGLDIRRHLPRRV